MEAQRGQAFALVPSDRSRKQLLVQEAAPISALYLEQGRECLSALRLPTRTSITRWLPAMLSPTPAHSGATPRTE